ncbi:MAG: hypothetical protein IJV12_00370 [Acidaminococcaceae bacterium]|nr:hypothetical protein [Acidaminococcaceae bacterium]
MDEKENPVQVMDKAKNLSVIGKVCRDSKLHYTFKIYGHGIVTEDCKVEIAIETRLSFKELAEALEVISKEMIQDISGKETKFNVSEAASG